MARHKNEGEHIERGTKHHSSSLMAAAGVLTLAFFGLDLLLPLGVAGGVPYVGAVMLAVSAGSEGFLLFVAALSTALTALGYFLSPAGADLSIVWLNRSLAIFAIWSVAVLGLRHQRYDVSIGNALHQKEVLLRELHHRVKNNLQVISSILQLHHGTTNSVEARAVLEISRQRIETIAQLHEMLHQSDDISQIAFGEYLYQLATGLNSAFGDSGRISLICECDPVNLDLNLAVPCGLLVNELVTNSLKHAFPDERIGEIRVELRIKSPGRCVLSVDDNGIGNSPSEATATLGMRLIQALSRQVGGEPSRHNDQGTHFELEFDIV